VPNFLPFGVPRGGIYLKYINFTAHGLAKEYRRNYIHMYSYIYVEWRVMKKERDVSVITT